MIQVVIRWRNLLSNNEVFEKFFHMRSLYIIIILNVRNLVEYLIFLTSKRKYFENSKCLLSFECKTDWIKLQASCDWFLFQQKNPFAGTSTNLDDLIKSTIPLNDKVRQRNSMSVVVTSSYRAFDVVYKDLKPPKPLQCTEFCKMSDIIKQQCFQTQDLRLQDRRGWITLKSHN